MAAPDWYQPVLALLGTLGAGGFAALATRGWATRQARRDVRLAERRYDAAYDYIADLRRQLHANDIEPKPWPDDLAEDAEL